MDRHQDRGGRRAVAKDELQDERPDERGKLEHPGAASSPAYRAVSARSAPPRDHAPVCGLLTGLLQGTAEERWGEAALGRSSAGEKQT